MSFAAVRLCRRCSVLCAVAVAGAGFLGLLGWIFGIDLLQGVFHGVTIKPNAVVALMLLGLALGLLQEQASGGARRVARAAAALAALIGGLTFAEHLTQVDLGIDELLFREPPGAPATTSPGRMGPPAALALLLAGVSLLLLERNSRRAGLVAQGLALVVCMVATVPLIGYAHGLRELFGIAQYTGIAFHTACALFLLALGIILSRPTFGLMEPVCAADAGGIMARRLVLPATLLPFVTGWVRWAAESSGVINPSFGRPLSVLFLSSCAFLLILFNARGLSRLDRDRARRLHTEQFLNRLHQQFTGLKRPGQILRTAAELLAGHFGAERCVFAQYEPAGRSATILFEYRADGLKPLGASEQAETFAPAGWAGERPQACLVDDVETAPALRPFRERYRQLQVRAYAIAGYDADGSALVLVVASRQPRRWREDEAALLKTVVDRVWLLVERAQSEQALRRSERRLRAVMDNAPVLLASITREWWFALVNQSCAAHFGRSPSEMIGMSVEEVLGSANFARFRPHIEAALAGDRVEVEEQVEDEVQGTRWVQAIFTPEETAEGDITTVVALITDISDRKRVEQELERARDEALAASRAKDAFIATLSHELRTPLSPVLLIASEAAVDPTLPPEVRNDFALIRHHVELEARLIDDLLDLTRITQGKFALDVRDVSGTEVLREALAVIRPDAEAKDLRMTIQAPVEPVPVRGDTMRLQQVFWNVLKNAVKFTPPGGTIAVEAAVVAADFAVTVRDTGLGMTEDELHRAFEAFSQGEHAANAHQFGGLGLGLAISRLLVTLHGGSIAAQSEGRGKGTAITITLPLATTPEGGVASTKTGRRDDVEAPVGPVVPAASTAGLRVLVVEDHAPTRDALVSLLRRRKMRVQGADSKRQALALAVEQPFDLVISDLGLPDGDGCDLMAELHRTHGLRGVAITGYGMETDIARTLRAGFVAHLTKPVRIQALDEALSTVLRPPSELGIR